MKATDLSETLQRQIDEQASERSMPDMVRAMKARLSDKHFSDEDWLYERKLDGERVLVRFDKEARLFSRNEEQLNTTYPEVVDELNKMTGTWWADGEMVAFDGAETSFSRLQNRMHIKDPKPSDIDDTKVYLYLFDCMYFDGRDVSPLPLQARKQILKEIITFNDPIRYLQGRRKDGEAYFKEACSKGWEGLIAKRAGSSYQNKRSSDWLKFKCVNQQEFIIIGYTPPQGERTFFGALLLGYHENDRLRYAGKAGTGFDEQERKNLMQRFEPIEQNESPTDDDVDEDDVGWLEPCLVAEIGFSEWTEAGKLRHPRYLGLRRDKQPDEVVREST